MGQIVDDVVDSEKIETEQVAKKEQRLRSYALVSGEYSVYLMVDERLKGKTENGSKIFQMIQTFFKTYEALLVCPSIEEFDWAEFYGRKLSFDKALEVKVIDKDGKESLETLKKPWVEFITMEHAFAFDSTGLRIRIEDADREFLIKQNNLGLSMIFVQTYSYLRTIVNTNLVTFTNEGINLFNTNTETGKRLSEIIEEIDAGISIEI